MVYASAMHELRWYYRVGKVILLPMVIVFGMQWAQAHQPVRDASTVKVVDVPTCTAPAQGTLPSGVILLRARGYVQVDNDRTVGRALDQQFGGKDNGLTIIAFCGGNNDHS